MDRVFLFSQPNDYLRISALADSGTRVQPPPPTPPVKPILYSTGFHVVFLSLFCIDYKGESRASDVSFIAAPIICLPAPLARQAELCCSLLLTIRTALPFHSRRPRDLELAHPYTHTCFDCRISAPYLHPTTNSRHHQPSIINSTASQRDPRKARCRLQRLPGPGDRNQSQKCFVRAADSLT